MTSKVIAFFPMYNEESNLRQLLERFQPVLQRGVVQEVLAVNDGSTDGSAEILRDCEYCTTVTHATRIGCGDAIRSGYRYALEHNYDVVVVLAGNGKDDPAEIERLIAPILRGEADYVQGSRYLKGGYSEGLPMHRNVAIRIFTWTFSLFLMRRFTDCTNGFRAYRTELLRDKRIQWEQDWIGPGYELEYYMHYKAAACGYRVREVPVSKVYRPAPDGSYTKTRWRDWITNLRPLFYLRLGLRK